MVQQLSFAHEVDAGDLIYSLASVNSLGGGSFYLKRKKPQLYGILKELFESQEYISEFKLHKDEPITHDFSNFRTAGLPYGITLGELHARWIGATPDWRKPWLTANPDPAALGKIVVSRTGRYHNIHFPWMKLVEALGSKMAFVGFEHEWLAFCRSYGRIKWIKTKNLHHVAQVIRGSELFIGNQSSPNAICHGLKHPMIQETCLFAPDCIYPQSDAIYCYDGNLSFEFQGKRYEFPAKPRPRMSRNECPPGGWKILIGGRIESSYSFHALCDQIKMKMKNDTPANLESMIEQYTISGLPIEAIPNPDIRHIRAIKSILQQ